MKYKDPLAAQGKGGTFGWLGCTFMKSEQLKSWIWNFLYRESGGEDFLYYVCSRLTNLIQMNSKWVFKKFLLVSHECLFPLDAYKWRFMCVHL